MLSCLNVSMFEIHTDKDQTEEGIEELKKKRFAGNVLIVRPDERAILMSGISVGQQSGFKAFITKASENKFVIGLG